MATKKTAEKIAEVKEKIADKKDDAAQKKLDAEAYATAKAAAEAKAKAEEQAAADAETQRLAAVAADAEAQAAIELEVKEKEKAEKAALKELDKLPKEPAYDKAPDAAGLPVIKEGDWVRLRETKGVPKTAIGLAAVVTVAVIKTAGPDTHADNKYEYQEADAPFTVKVRETGEHLVVTRSAFLSFAADEKGLKE